MLKENKLTVKEFIENGKCPYCGKNWGNWAVEGGTFCVWHCAKCNKETKVYWD